MEAIHGVYSAEGKSWALSGSAGLISGQWKSSSESSPQNSPGSVSSGFFPTPSSSPGHASRESSRSSGSRTGIFGNSKTGGLTNPEMSTSGNSSSGNLSSGNLSSGNLSSEKSKPKTSTVSRASMARFSLNDYPLIVDWEKTFSDQTRKSSMSSQVTLTLKDTKPEINSELKVETESKSELKVKPKSNSESEVNESNSELKVKPDLNSEFGVKPKLNSEFGVISEPKSSKSKLKPGYSGNIPDPEINSNNRFFTSNLADEVQIAQMNRQATVVRACRTKSRRAKSLESKGPESKISESKGPESKGPESKPWSEEKIRENGMIDQVPSMQDLAMLCADQKVRRRPSQIRVRKDHWRTEKRHERELQRLKKGSRRGSSSEVSRGFSEVSKISKEVPQEVFKELRGSNASKESSVEKVENQLESLKLESNGLYVGIDTDTGSSGDRTKGTEKEGEKRKREKIGERGERGERGKRGKREKGGKRETGRKREDGNHREIEEKGGKRENGIKGYETHTVEESETGNKKLVSGSNEPDIIQEGSSSNQRTTSSQEDKGNEQVGETQPGEDEVLDLGRELVKGQSMEELTGQSLEELTGQSMEKLTGQSLEELRGQSMRELREELIKGELIRQSAEKETLDQISQERRDFCGQFIKRSKNQEAGKSRRQIRLESKSQKSQGIQPQIKSSRVAHIHDINNIHNINNVHDIHNIHDLNNIHDFHNTQAYHVINNKQDYHDINNLGAVHDFQNINDSNQHDGVHPQSFNQPFSQPHIQDINNHFIYDLKDHDNQPVSSLLQDHVNVHDNHDIHNTQAVQAQFDNHEHNIQNLVSYQMTASQITSSQTTPSQTTPSQTTPSQTTPSQITSSQTTSSHTTSSHTLAYEESISAQQNALRYVRAAERDRQRVLNFPQGDPPKDEYSVIDKDIPPYQAQLHRYLDLMAYDERFSPVLRVNRYLVHGDGELADAIAKFSQFNLIPTDLWSVSHVDERDYERLIPELIPSDPYI